MLSRTPLEGLSSRSSVADTGYVVTIRVPLTSANFPAAGWTEGRPVRLALLVNDKDDPDAKEPKSRLGWAFSAGGNNHRDASGWRTLTLSK